MLLPPRVKSAPSCRLNGLLTTHRHIPLPHAERFTLRRLGKRYLTGSGTPNDGHIETKDNEGVLFFNSVFPRRLSWFCRFPLSNNSSPGQVRGPSAHTFDPVQTLKDALKAKGKEGLATVEGVTPLIRDGGAFVKFSHAGGAANDEIVEIVRDHQKKQGLRPWWNPFDESRASLVRGRPWIEDLYRPPSNRVKVEFEPEGAAGGANPELSQEQVYSILRPYGKLLEIRGQPPDSKTFPRYATVDYAQTRNAIVAKNCLHGYVVQDEEGAGKGSIIRLKISYERYQRMGWMKDWLFNHPRIVIPLLAAFAAFIATVVFDPIRTAFVKAHLTRSLHLQDSRILKWLSAMTARTSSILRREPRREETNALNAIFADRRSHIETLEKWLMETADTFIVVQGARGSGKRDLVVEQALKDRHNKIVIDCKKIQDARGDTATINATAAAVGYKPVFSWLNSISGLIDLAVQGTTGVKSGFSETLDGQLNKILGTTSTALRSVGLHDRNKKKDKDAHLADDDYLEAHPEKRSVVVIDNFLHRANSSDDNNNVIYDKLAEWAADLTSANIAHCIFLTTDVSFAKSLSKALPDRVFRQISLGDLPADSAKRFVVSHLDPEPDETAEDGKPEKKLTSTQRRKDLAELDDCIDALGGRLTDLEFLARRIRSGESPKAAVHGIIEQSASEILKMYVLGSRVSGERQWTAEQAWVLVKQLAENSGELKYYDLLMDGSFATAEGVQTLAALEQAELISVKSTNGRPYAITPGKPVFLPAFRMLTADRVLSAKMDAAILDDKIKTSSGAIDKAEEELRLIGQLPRQPAELAGRSKYLLAKIQAAQASIESLEGRVGELKEVLATEY